MAKRWQNCPTHAVAGLFRLYEQLLPTRLYASQKMGKDSTGAVQDVLVSFN